MNSTRLSKAKRSKKEHKIAESNQETVNEKDIHPKIHE